MDARAVLVRAVMINAEGMNILLGVTRASLKGFPALIPRGRGILLRPGEELSHDDPFPGAIQEKPRRLGFLVNIGKEPDGTLLRTGEGREARLEGGYQ